MAFPPTKKAPPPKKRPEDDDPDALGSPEGFGEPDQDDAGGPPDNDQDDDGAPQPGAGGPPGAPPMDGGQEPMITPDAVCFRSENETCQNCAYMGPDGDCAVLHISVGPMDGCNAFHDNGAQQGAPPPGAGAPPPGAGGPPMGGAPPPPMRGGYGG